MLKTKWTLLLSLSLLVVLVGLAGGIIYWPESPSGGSNAPPEPQASTPAPSRTGAVNERNQIEIPEPAAAETEPKVLESAARSTAPVVEQGQTGNGSTAQPTRFRRDETLSSIRADEVLSRLWDINPSLELTQEDVEEIDGMLQALIAEGSAAVPGIREFLESGEDLSFDGLSEETDNFQHDSLRLALFDALREIGGPDAEAALLAELDVTGQPAEISALAQHLEALAPEGYRVEIVEAARATLEAVKNSERQKEAGQLFQVLQSYGSAGVVTALNKEAPEWGYYTKVALAGLPDGEGIPALIDLVEKRDEADSGKDIFGDEALFAVQMLAQVAVDNFDAQQAFVEQVRGDRIPEALWPRIASALAGDDQFQLEKPDVSGLVRSTLTAGSKVKPHPFNTHTIGNTVIYTQHRSAKLSRAEIDVRIELVDLLMASSRNPTAGEALKTARDLLTDE